MAGAVRSLAFNLPAPILEANTQRLLARLLAWDRPAQRVRLPSPPLGCRHPPRRSRLPRPLQPGPDGPRRHALHTAGTEVPGLPPPLALPRPPQGRQDAIPLKAPRTEMREGSEACVILESGGTRSSSFAAPPTSSGKVSGSSPPGTSTAPTPPAAASARRLHPMRPFACLHRTGGRSLTRRPSCQVHRHLPQDEPGHPLQRLSEGACLSPARASTPSPG